MTQPPLLAALLLCCSYASVATAETLAPLLVEANGSEAEGDRAVGDVVLEEYTGSHQRIEREELQRPGASLAESIGFEAGVQYRQAGAEGSYSTITLRGASAAQTPVFWDGIRLNGAAQPSVDLSDLELLNLESVDIYKGSSPAQLGGGIGGAVTLNSPRTRGHSSTLRIQGGSFGSRGLQVGSSRGNGYWQADALLSHRAADNDFALINDNGTELYQGDDERQHRHNANFERNALLLKLRVNPDANTQYDLRLQHTDREQGVPEWRNRADNIASYNTSTTLVQLNQRINALQGSDWNLRLGTQLQRRREDYDDRLSQVGLGAQHTRSLSDSLGLSAYAEHIGESGTSSLQAEWRNEKMRNDDWADSVRSSARRHEYSLNAQYAWFSADERWLLTPALRWQQLSDLYNGLYRDGKDRRRNRHSGASIGLQFTPNNRWRWQANMGKHHREPGFHELFGDRGLHVGNDELTAESGFNTDLSLRWQHAHGSLQLGAFNSDRDNLIATVFSAQGIGHSENIGGARVRGLELSAEQQLAPRWQLRATATAQDAKNTSRIKASYGKQLPGQAQLQGALRLSHQRSSSRWWIESTALDGKYYDTTNLLPAADQLLHNAGVSWQHHDWQWALSVHNLGNDNIEDFNGFIKPGRSTHLSVRYHFAIPTPTGTNP